LIARLVEALLPGLLLANPFLLLAHHVILLTLEALSRLFLLSPTFFHVAAESFVHPVGFAPGVLQNALCFSILLLQRLLLLLLSLPLPITGLLILVSALLLLLELLLLLLPVLSGGIADPDGKRAGNEKCRWVIGKETHVGLLKRKARSPETG
jgi:hypothetical protein